MRTKRITTAKQTQTSLPWTAMGTSHAFMEDAVMFW